METNYREELKNYDIVKVLMMLLIILYHSMALWVRGGWFNQPPVDASIILTYLATWLNSFHIYVFTFVSGYLFYYLNFECGKYSNFILFVTKKIKRLMIPYILTASLWCIPFQLYFFKSAPTEVIIKYLFAFSPAQLWFLVMLFVLSIGFFLVADFVNNHTFTYMFALFFFIYFSTYVVGRFIPNIFQIITAMKYGIFYYMGFSFRKYKPAVLYRINFGFYLISNILLFFLYMTISISGSMPFKILTILIQPCLNISGVLMVIIGINKIGYMVNTENKLYRFFKKYNFSMYLFHQQVIYVVISQFNGIVNPYVLVIINFSFALIISGILSILLDKLNISLLKKVNKFV